MVVIEISVTLRDSFSYILFREIFFESVNLDKILVELKNREYFVQFFFILPIGLQ